jgi:hypothetical protein
MTHLFAEGTRAHIAILAEYKSVVSDRRWAFYRNPQLLPKKNQPSR